MAPEQTKTYMQAFSGWQRLNPKTKLGRPPPGKKIIFILARCVDLYHQGLCSQSSTITCIVSSIHLEYSLGIVDIPMV